MKNSPLIPPTPHPDACPHDGRPYDNQTTGRDDTAAADPILAAHELLVERGGRTVLDLDRFVINPGETVAVVGPNGAGKSTLLLTLSMLLKPSRGTLLFHGRPMTNRTALDLRRNIGLVLADPLLLETSVLKNTVTGLAFRGIRGAEAERRADEWLDRFGILFLRNRHARELSSGEAQRVSLARAFVLEPELLLLDEPFSSVDVAARAALVADTARLLRETSTACVLVTHDLDEASRLGTQIAVIVDGRLRQRARPSQVLDSPVDTDVAAFVGFTSQTPGTITTSHDGLASVATDRFTLRARSAFPPGSDVMCCLRATDITITLQPPHDDRVDTASTAGDASPRLTSHPDGQETNRLPGHVTEVSEGVSTIDVIVDCGQPIMATMRRQQSYELDLRPGSPVDVVFDASAVRLIRR